MDWRKFVTFVSDRGEHLLSEQLKRISVEKFETGVLEGCGPVFCVNFFAQLERRKKLAELLAEYSKVGDADSWRVGISESTAGGRESPGSLADEDSKARAATEDDIKRDIAGHPVVENLKKAFPGSRLESITVKEPNS